jgi:hypothetical protein
LGSLLSTNNERKPFNQNRKPCGVFLPASHHARRLKRQAGRQDGENHGAKNAAIGRQAGKVSARKAPCMIRQSKANRLSFRVLTLPRSWFCDADELLDYTANDR